MDLEIRHCGGLKAEEEMLLVSVAPTLTDNLPTPAWCSCKADDPIVGQTHFRVGKVAGGITRVVCQQPIVCDTGDQPIAAPTNMPGR